MYLTYTHMYVAINNDYVVVHAFFVFFYFVYLASYRMRLFATCLLEHKITSSRCIRVLACHRQVPQLLMLLRMDTHITSLLGLRLPDGAALPRLLVAPARI